jgi:hypothetical protein
MYQLVTMSALKDEAVLQVAELIVNLLCIINLVESFNYRPHVSPSYIRPMRASHTICMHSARSSPRLYKVKWSKSISTGRIARIVLQERSALP